MTLAKTPLIDLPIAVLDFETTGLSAHMDRVVQVGVIHSQGTKRSAVALNSLINPQRSIDPRASAVHGITDKDVVRAPTFGAVSGRLLESLEGRVIAGYNAAFDLRFLRAELKRTGVDFESPFICVMELRQMMFGARRCRLAEACHEVGIRLDRAHDASGDAMATAMLLQRYIDILQQRDVHTIDHLARLGHRAFVFSFQRPGFLPTSSPVVAVTRHSPDQGIEDAERECERMNQRAGEAIARLEQLLKNSLRQDVRIHWDRLMASVEFDEAMPVPPSPKRPLPPDLSFKPDPKQMPKPSDEKYAFNENILHSLVPGMKDRKLQQVQDQYKQDLQAYRQRIGGWNRLVANYRKRVEQAKQQYATEMREYQEANQRYQQRRSAFIQRVTAFNERVTCDKAAYECGEPKCVARVMIRVLMNSQLPEDFADSVDLDFDATQRLVRVTRTMPGLDDMPTIKTYRLVKKDREVKEQLLSDAARKRLFDSVTYQLALRTANELFRGDTAKHLGSIEIRCVIDGFDPATGHPGRLVLAKLMVDRDRFETLRLENVDPEACFKELGGTTNGRPSNLKPIDVLPDPKRTDLQLAQS